MASKPSIIARLESRDEVSGYDLFTDGTRHHWGESGTIAVIRDGKHVSRPKPYVVATALAEERGGFMVERRMTPAEEKLHAATINA
jgi:hypothetical protein